jgi:ferredoxin
MSIHKLDKNAFNDFINALIGSEQEVLGVKAKDKRFAFGELDDASDLRLDYDVTILPPKKYVLPQEEDLMTFEVGGNYESTYDDRKMVLVGVHPYDMIAINQMDELFSQDEYDNHYMKRRENITIIASDVINGSDNIFASSMGTATVDTGYDILVTVIDDGYLLDVATDKGAEIFKLAKGASEASDGDLKAREEVWENNRKNLNKHKLNCEPSELAGLLEKGYDHPVWEEKARTCYSCGSCNQVCPTCYCFDVQDDVNWDLKKGKRFRAWDGCLLESFATVTGDHNFRKHRENRFRHRLYRKAKYVPEKIGGQIACVGCGRCVRECIPDIANPVEIYNRLIEDLS